MEGKNTICIKSTAEFVELLDELGKIESEKVGIEIKGYPNKTQLACNRIKGQGGWKKKGD